MSLSHACVLPSRKSILTLKYWGVFLLGVWECTLTGEQTLPVPGKLGESLASWVPCRILYNRRFLSSSGELGVLQVCKSKSCMLGLSFPGLDTASPAGMESFQRFFPAHQLHVWMSTLVRNVSLKHFHQMAGSDSWGCRGCICECVCVCVVFWVFLDRTFSVFYSLYQSLLSY